MTDRTSAPPLVTVGHGRLTTPALVTLLRGAGVEALADVRRHPGSRRHPHLARGPLAVSLEEEALAYRWIPELGGRRSGVADSPHTALRDASFRAYADHMETPAFRTALGGVLSEAARRRTAVMCSESLWWRCHRRLIADATVLLHEVAVEHLFHDGRLRPHVPTAEARVDGRRLVYDRGAAPSLPGM